jgi:hypothetical protein
MTKSSPKEVRLGRGPGCYLNPGNKEYRAIVKLYAPDFHRHAPKPVKTKFVENLHSKLEVQGFRFVSFSVQEQKWVDAQECEIREKIGHDLRDSRKYLRESKNKTRPSRSTTRRYSKHPKPLVEEDEANHAAIYDLSNENISQLNLPAEAHIEFQEKYNCEPNLFQLQKHIHDNKKPNADLQNFQMDNLHDNSSYVSTDSGSSSESIYCERLSNVASQHFSRDAIEGKQVFMCNLFIYTYFTKLLTL